MGEAISELADAAFYEEFFESSVSFFLFYVPHGE